MTDLDKTLSEVWDATAVETPPAAFNAAVLDRIARRRAWRELGVAALIAVAVWVVAWAVGPAIASVAAPLALLIAATPVVTAVVSVGVGLSLLAVMRGRFKVEPGFWSLGLRR